MEKYISILFIIFFSLTHVPEIGAREKISEYQTTSEKDLSETEKLAATAKIWGFLKYYHPAVTRGQYNWDEQLFEVLEKVETVKTSRELSVIFSNWIDSLGEVEECTECLSVQQKEVFLKNFDLSWIDSELFSKKLRKQLRHIEKNRSIKEQYYVTAAPAGNVVIQNESEYPGSDWEDKKIRLLSLFRYWNQVEYFFPYKYQMDHNWDESLKKLLPLFINADSERQYHLAMLQLTASLNDSHAYLVTDHTNRNYGYYWAPVKLKMIGGKAVVTGTYDKDLAAKDDWKLGDVLISVEGVPVSEILAEDKKYMSGSNEPAMLRNIEINLLNGHTGNVKIEFLRDGKLQKKEVSRFFKRDFDRNNTIKPKWKILDDKIGYVDMGLVENEDVQEMMKDLKKTKAIIFDIRNYPNGTLGAIAYEINSSSKPFAKFTLPDLSYPGKFTWTETYKIGGENPDAYKGKVILLVNEVTQSHAEFTAMALQTAPDATIIGSQTSGADGNVSDISILGQFKTYMSGVGVFYPDGRETQRVGIRPDIVVEPTIKGIKEGRDEVLEKAVEVALKKNS